MIENKNSDLTPFYKIIAALGDSVTNGYRTMKELAGLADYQKNY